MTARYANAGQTAIIWTDAKGTDWSVPSLNSDTQIGRDLRAWVDAGNTIAAFTPPPLTQTDYEVAIQNHIDATARTRGYGNGVALASYKLSTVPQWAAEAETFIAWRDSVWVQAYAALAAVQQGGQPPALQAFIASLPPINWPA